jgi:hypothetical protein
MARCNSRRVSVLARAAYFEEVHPPTAQETYNEIAQRYRGTEYGEKAKARLSEIEKELKRESKAEALANQIRRDCAFLSSDEGPAPNLSSPETLRNAELKRRARELLTKVDALCKNYRDTKVAKECLGLLAVFGIQRP